jgi:hypothetical protein
VPCKSGTTNCMKGVYPVVRHASLRSTL